MDVVGAALEISVVANCVLPESSLPESELAAMIVRDRCTRSDHSMREYALDAPPSTRVIRVTFRECHDDMQMIGQDNDCIDREWAFEACHTECAAELVNMV
ncbi:hypothetical protein SE92_01865 [Bradyrhizobium sp. AT1]|nr:hypothetical protein SE92_01865 [Bradyrhizobium sp. AT1]